MRMNTSGLRICALVLGIFVAASSVAAQKSTGIALSGSTSIAIASNSTQAKVILHASQRGEKSGARCDAVRSSNMPNTTSLEAVEIIVNGKTLFVPRSAYLALNSLRQAALQADGRTFILELSGGDAAESYFVRIYFDARGVHRKKLFSSIDGAVPLEDTHYRTSILKENEGDA
jgi:hypothetical protein